MQYLLDKPVESFPNSGRVVLVHFGTMTTYLGPHLITNKPAIFFFDDVKTLKNDELSL